MSLWLPPSREESEQELAACIEPALASLSLTSPRVPVVIQVARHWRYSSLGSSHQCSYAVVPITGSHMAIKAIHGGIEIATLGAELGRRLYASPYAQNGELSPSVQRRDAGMEGNVEGRGEKD